MCNSMLHSVLEFSETRPETLTAAAALCARLEEPDKALGLCDKALAADSTHAQALIVQGNLLLERQDFQGAISSFTGALQCPIKPLDAFRGVVRALLSRADAVMDVSPQHAAHCRKESLFIARKCSKMFPRNAHAFALLGISMLHSGEDSSVVRPVLEQALEMARLEPCVDATLAMAELLVREKKIDDAVTLLKEELESFPQNASALHVHIGEALELGERFDEAALHYKEALRQGHIAGAEEGLQRVLRRVQGDAEGEYDEDEYAIHGDERGDASFLESDDRTAGSDEDGNDSTAELMDEMQAGEMY